ncbi:hypothetical protein [Tellurirhabdus bombi]|uniref:hypothetical protein n=1 Tax=Tellurirhabdus bombi TaxID=2907205 RepID=UPI001F480841|nr:hypothetical protein [Tellurirhabdus bombi]
MTIRLFRAVYGLLVLTLLLAGCGGSREKKEEKKTAAPAAASLKEVHFFMETSASMGGYLRGGTEFKDVVSDVVTKANTIKPLKVWTITEKPQAYTGDARQFVEGLATTPLATGKSSKLHTIFEQVGQKAGTSNIAMLVTDAILSFPDNEIKANPEINRENASSVLKNQIYDQFSKLSQKGVGATVYAFTSQYNGTYYDYRNAKQKLSGEPRPFYIWLIGKQELLNDFNQKLQGMLSVQPAKVLNFGTGTALTDYELFFSLNKKGKWRAERGSLADMRARSGNPEEFAIGLDLGNLPAYAQSEDYLRKNLTVNAKEAAVKLATVQRKDDLSNTAKLSEREEKILNGVTHVLTFRVDNLYGNEATVAIKLPVRFDNWYEKDWTTLDDRTAAGRRGKTFALQYLMSGVKEAYQSSTNDFLNLTIKLKK